MKETETKIKIPEYCLTEQLDRLFWIPFHFFDCQSKQCQAKFY